MHAPFALARSCNGDVGHVRIYVFIVLCRNPNYVCNGHIEFTVGLITNVRLWNGHSARPRGVDTQKNVGKIGHKMSKSWMWFLVHSSFANQQRWLDGVISTISPWKVCTWRQDVSESKNAEKMHGSGNTFTKCTLIPIYNVKKSNCKIAKRNNQRKNNIDIKRWPCKRYSDCSNVGVFFTQNSMCAKKPSEQRSKTNRQHCQQKKRNTQLCCFSQKLQHHRKLCQNLRSKTWCYILETDNAAMSDTHERTEDQEFRCVRRSYTCPRNTNLLPTRHTPKLPCRSSRRWWLWDLSPQVWHLHLSWSSMRTISVIPSRFWCCLVLLAQYIQDIPDQIVMLGRPIRLVLHCCPDLWHVFFSLPTYTDKNNGFLRWMCGHSHRETFLHPASNRCFSNVFSPIRIQPLDDRRDSAPMYN